MSELTLVALRLGLVLALWIFVVVVVLVLRNDLFGTTVVTRSSRDPRREQRPASGPIGGAASEAGADPASLRTDPEITQAAMVVTAGPLRGTSLTLGSTPILIGRAPECTLVLDDDYASNRHEIGRASCRERV